MRVADAANAADEAPGAPDAGKGAEEVAMGGSGGRPGGRGPLACMGRGGGEYAGGAMEKGRGWDPGGAKGCPACDCAWGPGQKAPCIMGGACRGAPCMGELPWVALLGTAARAA